MVSEWLEQISGNTKDLGNLLPEKKPCPAGLLNFLGGGWGKLSGECQRREKESPNEKHGNIHIITLVGTTPSL